MKDNKKLSLEDDASNKVIYRFVPDEPDEKKRYRHERAEVDIRKRLKDISIYTGGLFTFDGPNREKVQTVALIRMMEKLGFWKELEFTDMFWLCADESVRNLEKQKYKIKADIEERKKQMNLERKKIIIPGRVNA